MPNEDSSIRQARFIRKIEAYLKGRGRSNVLDHSTKIEDITVEGLCNGASLWLLEKVFYDCLNRHYQTSIPMTDLLKNVLKNFFKEIDVIIATDDTLLNSQTYQQKLTNRKIPAYIEAKYKLDEAISSRKLQISDDIKKKYEKQFKALYVDDGIDNLLLQDSHSAKDYFLTLIELAKRQNMLTTEEATILLSEYIPDLPHFERFINQLFLLQTEGENFIFCQDDVAEKFEQLTVNVKDKKALPIPILDHIQTFMVTPEELIRHLAEFLPSERLVRISFPQHVVAAFHIDDHLFYYDPNNDQKEFVYCETPIIFVLKLALSELMLAYHSQKLSLENHTQELFDKQIIDYDQYLNSLPFETQSDITSSLVKSREWLTKHPAVIPMQIMLLKKSIEKLKELDLDKDKAENVDVLLDALKILPQTLGFTCKIYRHLDSPLYQYPTDAELFTNLDLKEIMNRTDFSNETLLIKLVDSGQHETLKKFLIDLENFPQEERLKLLNHANKDGERALSLACLIDHVGIIVDLLKAGANPNFVDENEISPLIIAVNHSNIEMVKVLVDYDANVNQKYKNSSPFILSCESQGSNHEIFDCLLPHANLNDLTIGTPPLFLCMTNKQYYRIESLLKRGADVDIRLAKNSESSLASSFPEISALRYAIYLNDPKIVMLLLKYGAKIEKDVPYLINKNDNKMMVLFLQFPFMAKGDTKAEQLHLLFHDYANPLTIAGLFPTTWRHYKAYAEKISHELKKPGNKHLDDKAIEVIIAKIIADIPGGYDHLRNGEFKKRLDLVLNHFLKTDEQPSQMMSLKQTGYQP